jgi:2-succinyl-5-enolpyruvyl-6-hydroxy-3-cyclohexene-1-carboxylate synthase
LANYSSIRNLTQICAQKGVSRFVLSPGSRCAPLTLALARNPAIHTHTVSDERSAAYIALGMALQSQETIGLVCTSGTAVLNYSPAIAEAFFQQVPLLVLTADRPPEWVGQQDGQTIYQREIFGKHVKHSFELPVEEAHPDAAWHSERIVNEAINLSRSFPPGPVHINVPLREPLYPAKDEEFIYERQVRKIDVWQAEATLSKEQWIEIRELWEDSDRKLIVGGQHPYTPELIDVLRHLQQELEIPVIGDVISNLHALPETIRYVDKLLMDKEPRLLEALRPDLLITFGNSVISKNLKQFLRKYKPRRHWHLQVAGPVADPFQTVTDIFSVHPVYFFKTLFGDLDFQNFLNDDLIENNPEYAALWQTENREAGRSLSRILNPDTPFGEFAAVREVVDALPENCQLHLANSMTVRYANFVGLPAIASIEVFANRGTSGIDGSTSTAVGAACLTKKLVTLITGDMAFFYDRNGLWHTFLPKNLRIIVLNNHGGGIFRLLDGPGGQPELEEYFETRQVLQAESTAREFGLDYFWCQTLEELQQCLPLFFESTGGAKLLEIHTSQEVNAAVFKLFKNA